MPCLDTPTIPCVQGVPKPGYCGSAVAPGLPCGPLPPCDDTIPTVVIDDIIYHENKQALEVTWQGAQAIDEVQFMLSFKADGNGARYAMNDIDTTSDIDAPATGQINIGDSVLKSGYEYLLSVRRLRAGAASPWVTIPWGLPIHKGAFSRGFRVDFS